MFHRTIRQTLFLLLACHLLVAPSYGGDDDTEKPTGPTFVLRYKFQPNEIIRWKVEQRAQIRGTINGTTQTAETVNDSTKVWQVTSVDSNLQRATFTHSVADVDMRHAFSGRKEVRYNSQTDAVPPSGFEEVAQAVGVPLSVFTIDYRGNIVNREEKHQQPATSTGPITIPLPDHPVAVGETWSHPYDVTVQQQGGGFKQIKTRQQFTLNAVDNGIATIAVETIILTPIHDPALEAQLVQHTSDGTVRFDIAAGRVVGQQMDIDKHVVGFSGDASSMHYLMRFTEELLRDAPTATKQKPATSTAPATAQKTNPSAAKTAKKTQPPATTNKTPTKSANSNKPQPKQKSAANTPKKQTPSNQSRTGNKPAQTQPRR